jgi:hypothetical protein
VAKKLSVSEQARRIASTIYPTVRSKNQHAAFVIGYEKGFAAAKREVLHKLMERDGGQTNSVG